jgi:hypothetical protein
VARSKRNAVTSSQVLFSIEAERSSLLIELLGSSGLFLRWPSMRGTLTQGRNTVNPKRLIVMFPSNPTHIMLVMLARVPPLGADALRRSRSANGNAMTMKTTRIFTHGVFTAIGASTLARIPLSMGIRL